MDSPVEFLRHQSSGIRSALQQCIARPITALLTVFSIGLALTLPGLLWSSLETLEANNISIEGERKINLFLKMETPSEGAMGLMNELTNDPKVSGLQQINPEQALQTLRDSTELGDTLAALAENPLPITIIVTPTPDLSNAQIEEYAAVLRNLPEVAQARVDSEYLQRLAQLGRFLKTLLVIISILFDYWV